MRVFILGIVLAAAAARCPLSPVGKPIPFDRVGSDVPFSVHNPRSIFTRRADGSACVFGPDRFGGMPYSIAADWARRDLLISVAVEAPKRQEFWRWSPRSGTLVKESTGEEKHGLRGMSGWDGEVVWLDSPPDLPGNDCRIRFAHATSPTVVAQCQGGIALNEQAVFFSQSDAVMRVDRATGEVRQIGPGSRPALSPNGRLAFFKPDGSIEVREPDGKPASTTDTKNALRLRWHRQLPMDTNPKLSWSADGDLVVTILQRGYAEYKVCEGIPCFESYVLDAEGTRFLASGIIGGSPIVFSANEKLTCPAGTERPAPTTSGR